MPLSYTYYNANLVDSNTTKHTLKIAYHNDIVFLAREKMFKEALRKLKDMMTECEGALECAKTHKSLFEIDKMALIAFTCRREKDLIRATKTKKITCPSISILGQTIKPQ